MFSVLLRRIAFVLGVLLLSSTVASAQNVIHAGPTQFVPGDAVVQPAAANQQSPTIAAGGSTYLVAWADDRGNSTNLYEHETSTDIYAMRLDSSGNLLDSVPFVVSAGRATQVNPQIAWNGTHWLVVYESYGLSGTGFYYEKSLEAVRIAPDGTRVDAQPIKINGIVPQGGMWSVASDGTNWVLVSQPTAAGNTAIVGLRIAADGTLLDPPTRTLVPGTYYLRFNMRLAYSNGVFLMTFDEGSNGTGAIRFDSNLTLLDPALYILHNTVLNSLSGGSNGFYILWSATQGFNTVVTGSRVSTAGSKLDPAGVNISGSNSPSPYTTIAALWDGTNWRVTWENNGALRAARVSSAGAVLDPGGVAVSGPLSGKTAGVGDGSFVTTWVPYVNANYDVVTARVSSSNVPSPNRTVSLGAPMQLHADTAASGSGYMMVYRSSSAGAHRILAQPLDANGVPLSAEPVELENGPYLNGPGAPAVAWNGSLYMVTWGTSSGVVAQRLQPDGTKVDAAPFLVLSSAFGPTDIEALGDTFLVVARKFGYTTQIINTFAARVVGSTGAVLDPSGINVGFVYASYPRVVVLGNRWFLAWRDNFTHDDPLANTLGAFIDANGVPTASFGLRSYYSTAGGNGIFTVGLASNGTKAMMVQSQELSSGVETDMLFVLVDETGAVTPAVNATPWIGNQYRPNVAWDGTHFIITYQEQKNRFAPHTLDQLDARSDLYGMRVTADGVIVDPNGFVFSNSPYSEAYPNIVGLPGHTLFAASLVRQEAPLVNYRVGYSLLGQDGNQWPVAVATATPGLGNAPLTVTFSSAGSADLDGTISGYSWAFGDGGTSTAANPVYTYVTPGDYVATLTVTDNGGAQTTQAVKVEVQAPNQPPIAIAAVDVTSGPAPLAVVFDASGSYDPDGSLGNIKWDFDDNGTIYWGSTAYHTFSNPGTYDVELTVWDSDGATGTDIITITVTGSGCNTNCLRVSQIMMGSGTSGGTLYVGGRVVVRNEAGSAVQSARVYVTVDRPDGSSVSVNKLTNAQGRAILGAAYVGPGTYTLTVTNITRSGYTFDPDNSTVLQGTIVMP